MDDIKTWTVWTCMQVKQWLKAANGTFIAEEHKAELQKVDIGSIWGLMNQYILVQAKS